MQRIITFGQVKYAYICWLLNSTVTSFSYGLLRDSLDEKLTAFTQLNKINKLYACQFIK